MEREVSSAQHYNSIGLEPLVLHSNVDRAELDDLR